MSELLLKDVKVGDKICVIRYFSPARLLIVDKVTPSGRVVTKSGTFTPDDLKAVVEIVQRYT